MKFTITSTATFAATIAAIMLAGCNTAAHDAGERPVAANVQLDTPQAEGWALVWSDEFDGDTLDRSKWLPEESCWGGANDERQCYTDRPENVEVSGGMLRLKARPERFTGASRPPELRDTNEPMETRPYTSGKVRTRGLHAWKYARVDIRAKPVAGQGAWPALWMMPDGDAYGRWPLSGEIDILETVNLGAKCSECAGDVGENRTVSALHYGDVSPGNEHVAKASHLPDLSLPSDDFHTFSVEWGAGLIRFFVDGRPHFEVTPDQWWSAAKATKSRPAAPFDQPFYLMANLAVGGNWPENVNERGIDATAFPSEFTIDWVRVYQCTKDRDTGRACMD